MLHDRQTGGSEEPLHDVFVHAGSRAQDTGSDIRNVRKLKQTLNRPIFAKGSVQDGKDDVHIDRVLRSSR